LCGADLPADRGLDGDRIDGLVGLDGPLPAADRPFVYILDGSIEAIRSGTWKLHVRKRRRELLELYDLADDVGETTDVAAEHPDVVARLSALLDAARLDLGDDATGTVGRGVRPIGRVDDPKPLTTFDPDHPYYAAEYDLPHRG
jgi:arylsulfatase A-like enzyme